MLGFGLLLCHKEEDTPLGNCEQRMFLFCFVVYSIFTIAVALCIHNPIIDYFINSDSSAFYIIGEEYQGTSFLSAQEEIFSEFKYRDAVAGFYIRFLLYRLGCLFQVTNLYLFSALSNVFFASLIPVFILKMLRGTSLLNGFSLKMTYLYALLSPIMIEVPQLTRDIHIALIYVIILYCFLEKELMFRYFIMLILSALVYYFRQENAFYAFGIILLCLLLDFQKMNSWKYMLFPILTYLFIFLLIYIVPTAENVVIRYNQRDFDLADSNSLAVRLFSAFPFPLDVLAKTVFCQMLPFPVTVTLNAEGVAVGATLVSWLTPFFWLPVQICCLVFFFKNTKSLFQNNLPLTVLYLNGLLYIITVSSAQVLTRRTMAMYPAIFLFFCLSVKEDKASFKNIAVYTGALFFILHVIYFLLKKPL